MREDKNWIEANKEIWNRRTDAHLSSEFYDVRSFLEGKETLNACELELLGDLRNQSLLHLQCHFGQDTLSLARRGADVTGLDFSEAAIDAARKLNEKTGLNAKFYCASVYDTRAHIKATFDIVFTSYGVIGWLPDLRPWAQVVADSLNPGGIFVMCEFHPYVWMMDEQYETIKYNYFNKETIISEVTGSYAGPENLHEPLKEFGWNHPFTDVFNALLHTYSMNMTDLPTIVFREWNCTRMDCTGFRNGGIKFHWCTVFVSANPVEI